MPTAQFIAIRDGTKEICDDASLRAVEEADTPANAFIIPSVLFIAGAKEVHRKLRKNAFTAQVNTPERLD
jgi:hypothetical protein